ncbi:hypothetical protein NM688_g4773 [Phlebia brevispora]|uniref:Uncharacterized protein n=1 Tax=Phlebia brevispora TaxID=194682 RepID=A0ACC1T1P1_9APHY|nr:hypothetical protein NM688_g4773 [Phlebia brevispora]
MLPPELISHIIGHVHMNKDQQGLISCSLVSSAWHELTRPFLFREVTFKYTTEEEETQTDGTREELADEEVVEDRGWDEGRVSQRRSAVLPEIRQLISFLAFLCSCPAVAEAICVLGLVASRYLAAGNTDPSLLMRVLQRLPRLRILRITNVAFTGLHEAISQARTNLHYQPISLDELHYTIIDQDAMPFVHPLMEPIILDVHRVPWLFALFRRIHTFYIDAGMEGRYDEDAITAQETTRVERIFVRRSRGLYSRRSLLRAVDLRTVRSMNLGVLEVEDLVTFGHLCSNAVNLEYLSYSVPQLALALWCGVFSYLLFHSLILIFASIGYPRHGAPRGDELDALTMIRSQKLRTLTLRHVALFYHGVRAVTEILHRLPRRLAAKTTVDHPQRPPLTVRIIFTTVDAMIDGMARRILRYLQEECRGPLDDLEKVLLQLTSRHPDMVDVKLRLCHSAYTGQDWHELVTSMFPNFHRLNIELK